MPSTRMTRFQFTFGSRPSASAISSPGANRRPSTGLDGRGAGGAAVARWRCCPAVCWASRPAGAGGEGGEEGVGPVGVPAVTVAVLVGLGHSGLQMGVEDRLHAGEGGGGELASDGHVALGTLPDAQAPALVQSSLAGRFVLGGSGCSAGLVGRGAGLAQIVTSLGPGQQPRLTARICGAAPDTASASSVEISPDSNAALVVGQPSSLFAVSSARAASAFDVPFNVASQSAPEWARAAYALHSSARRANDSWAASNRRITTARRSAPRAASAPDSTAGSSAVHHRSPTTSTRSRSTTWSVAAVEVMRIRYPNNCSKHNQLAVELVSYSPFNRYAREGASRSTRCRLTDVLTTHERSRRPRPGTPLGWTRRRRTDRVRPPCPGRDPRRPRRRRRTHQ